MAMTAEPEIMVSREEFSENRKYLSYSEKILYLIDETNEILTPWDSLKPTRMDAINDLMKIMIGRKLNTSLYEHEFAIFSFNSQSHVRLIHPFSRSINSFNDIQLHVEEASDNVEEVIPDFGIIFQNLDQLLSTIVLNSDNNEENSFNLSKNSIIRVILIYSRSNQIPNYSLNIFTLSSAIILKLFFIDMIFIHYKFTSTEMVSLCQQIFEKLNTIQQHLTPTGHQFIYENHYLFETHPNTSKLLTIITALLCHPFQRDNQIKYLEKLEITNEIRENMMIEIDKYRQEMGLQQQQQCTTDSTSVGSSKGGGSGSGSGSSSGNTSASAGPTGTNTSQKKFGRLNIFTNKF